jgi:hypothetical protein
MVNIGQFWLSNKKHCIVNMVSSAVLWSIWKLRNDLCFQRIGWKSMDMLLYGIAGLLQNWIVVCPGDKKEVVTDIVSKIKSLAGESLWLPYTPLGPRHHMKLLKGGPGEVIWECKNGEGPGVTPETSPWWKALDVALI